MKQKNDYFSMMTDLCAYSMKAADKLTSCLTNFAPDRIQCELKEMHEIEQAADEARHVLLKKLSREFITPIERDDILRLVQIIDDVTDAIDEVVIKLYMFNVSDVPPEALKLADLVARCVKALWHSVSEFRHFKKSEKLNKWIVEVNNIESEADGAYIEAMHALFASKRDAMITLGIREVYDCLESCCDLCEHAADAIEYIVLANT